MCPFQSDYLRLHVVDTCAGIHFFLTSSQTFLFLHDKIESFPPLHWTYLLQSPHEWNCPWSITPSSSTQSSMQNSVRKHVYIIISWNSVCSLCLKLNIYFTFLKKILSTKLDSKLGLVLMWVLRKTREARLNKSKRHSIMLSEAEQNNFWGPFNIYLQHVLQIFIYFVKI